MNSVNLIGRLTRDPEMRPVSDDSTLCELRLAVDGMGRGREVGFVDVVVFGKSGEAAARVLAKGWLVAVYGRVAYREWSAADGARRSAHSIVGNVEFLAAPRSNGEATDTAPVVLDESGSEADEVPF